jgi:hypothetical protein
VTVTHLHSGETKTIDKKDPKQAHKAPGWMTTADGKSTAQFNFLRHKAKLFDAAILQSGMEICDATTVYN